MSKPTNSLGITPEIVNTATVDLPEAQRRAIRWLYSHATEKGMSRKDVGEILHYNENTIYQVFTGSHGAGKKKIVEAIERYKNIQESRVGSQQLSYIETDLTRRVWKLCAAALTFQKIGFIYGDSQIGKTTALEEYAITHNHGETIYIRMPEGGAMEHFLWEMKNALKINGNPTLVRLKRMIADRFDSQMLLIIDEAHQCFNLSPRSQSIKPVRVLEYIREIHDRSKCGIIISATNIFRNELEKGKNAKILEQIKLRRLASLQLPDAPTKKDLNTFADAYGLAPASDDILELQTDVIREEALGFWLTLLRMTAARCHRDSQTMTWADVQKSHTLLRKLEG